MMFFTYVFLLGILQFGVLLLDLSSTLSWFLWIVEKGVWFYSLVCMYLVSLTPFIEEIIFSPLRILAPLSKIPFYCLGVGLFLALYSVPLVYMPLLCQYHTFLKIFFFLYNIVLVRLVVCFEVKNNEASIRSMFWG